MRAFGVWLLAAGVAVVNGLGKTDTITWGGDNSRTGYQTNHNMDPSIVGSSQFGQLFKTALPGKWGGAAEQIFSQPLVYTPSNGTRQYVYWATTQNNLYKMDAKTGVIVASRSLHIPFLTADLNGCVDINPAIGVTATGVIDPDTDTLYLTAKTYVDQTAGPTAQGLNAGRYFVHAINVNDLSERPNFPVALDGLVGSNNDLRVFSGGMHHQRPGLLQAGDYIYAGFASHCVQYNFTGWIIGWHKGTGKIVERYATEGKGVGPDIKGGGIWMSGGGIAYDGAGSIFLGTGNGYASQLATIPVKGFNPPTALEEAALHMTINADGSLKLVDFFMPWEKQALDGADKDLGTSPLEILPNQFSCGDIKRIGVITGKSGKTYWLNLDNMGGYRNGADGLDAVIQMYPNANSVYAGAGVYPLEGGYIYINVIQHPSNIFKFACNNGVPSFSLVATTPETNAYILGVSHGTTTSLNGQPGTGLFWVTDVQGLNLRIYNAVPNGDKLTLINSFSIPGVTKFTRPVFGDGIVYIGTTVGYVYGYGSPVNQPLNCTSPVEFGAVDRTVKGSNATVSAGTAASSNQTVTCKANIGLSVTGIELSDRTDYSISDMPTIPLAMNAGDSFVLKGTFAPKGVGLLTADVIFNTTNNVAGYSINTHARLMGTGRSPGPLLDVTPNTVTFQGYVTGQDPNGGSETIIMTNRGNSPLTVQKVLYSANNASGPYETWNGQAGGDLQVGKFTLQKIPATVDANSVASINIKFDTATSGTYAAFVKFVSDGGTISVSIAGSSGPAAVVVVEFQTLDGQGWVKYNKDKPFDFGNVTQNTARPLKMRITNGAPVGGVKLSLTVSKPPFGIAGIIRAANQVDLAEGTSLGPGESGTATLTCAVPKSQWNVDSYNGTAQWTLNTNDPIAGKQFIQFYCNAVAEQAPPLRNDSQGAYRYMGCYKENNPGRQLQSLLYGDDKATNAMCIAACAAGNYAYCGTQYHRECWAGNTVPSLKVPDNWCNFDCAGSLNQICGGNGEGTGAGGAYISLFGNPEAGGDKPNPGGPSVNPSVSGYSSIGCYTESTTGRALPKGKDTEKRTVKQCVDACKFGTSPFVYAGLEYGGECWCGNAFSAGAVPAPIGDCNMPCNDNTTEFCGAGSRLNVYKLDTTTPTPTPTPSSLSSSSSSPSSSSSALPSSSSVVSSVTPPVNSLNSTATPSSSSMIPVSSSTPLSSTPTPTPTPTPSSTSTTSTPTPTPTPTGPTVKDVVAGKWKSQGCWTEADGGRALPDKMVGDDAMTLEMCAKFCDAYKYFGTEYTRECWCANSINPKSALATKQTDCSMVCGGDKLAYCGGPGRLNVYQLMEPSLTASTSSTSPTSPAASTSPTASTGSPDAATSSTPTSTPTPTPTGPVKKKVVGDYWNFQGCYTEPQTGGRGLTGKSYADDKMTLESCASYCAGFTYFGTEYGRECYCGNDLKEGTNSAADQGDCKFTCAGDKTQFCGAGLRLELYKFGSVSSSTAPTTTPTPTPEASTSPAVSSSTPVVTPTTTPTTPSSASSASSAPATPESSSSATPSSSTAPKSSTVESTPTTTATPKPTPTGPSIYPGNVNFTYIACVSEPSNGRLLATQIYNDNKNMTIETCLQKCQKYSWAGVEYGQECWCGNKLQLDGGQNAKTPGKNVSDTDCNFLCPGNRTQYCGAGVRMSVYSTTRANFARAEALYARAADAGGKKKAAAAPCPPTYGMAKKVPRDEAETEIELEVISEPQSSENLTVPEENPAVEPRATAKPTKEKPVAAPCPPTYGAAIKRVIRSLFGAAKRDGDATSVERAEAIEVEEPTVEPRATAKPTKEKPVAAPCPPTYGAAIKKVVRSLFGITKREDSIEEAKAIEVEEPAIEPRATTEPVAAPCPPTYGAAKRDGDATAVEEAKVIEVEKPAVEPRATAKPVAAPCPPTYGAAIKKVVRSIFGVAKREDSIEKAKAIESVEEPAVESVEEPAIEPRTTAKPIATPCPPTYGAAIKRVIRSLFGVAKPEDLIEEAKAIESVEEPAIEPRATTKPTKDKPVAAPCPPTYGAAKREDSVEEVVKVEEPTVVEPRATAKPTKEKPVAAPCPPTYGAIKRVARSLLALF